MAQPQAHAAEGFFAKGEDIHTAAEPVHITPKGLEVSTSSEHERTGEPLHAVGTGNEVLERDAQSKGHWFQYLKTKQFWLTMLLGQGMTAFPSNTPHHKSSNTNTSPNSPRYLHNLDQHALLSPRKRRHIDPSLPILFQLCPAQPRLHHLHYLQIWIQAVGTPRCFRRLAILHPRVFRCRG